jgi:hypothetical protein
MWLWAGQLHSLGFRRLGEFYWQCEVGYSLGADSYLSLFAHTLDGRPRRRARSVRQWLEVAAFHVTFCLGVDRVHFYYHEVGDGIWEPGGHTSSGEIRRHGVEPGPLRHSADATASEFLAVLNGRLLARG